MKDFDILRKQCRIIFLTGAGNYWYEEDTAIGDDKRLLYKIYGGVILLVYNLMILFEALAAIYGDFPEDEQGDSVSFATSHFILMLQIINTLVKKDVISALNERMIEVCDKHEEPRLMEHKYEVIKKNMFVYFATVYGSTAFCVVEGLRKYFTGSHFVTIITLYPSHDDGSTTAVFTRVLTTLCLFHMMFFMIVSVHSLVVSHLIMYKYKFITLRHYLNNLREDVEKHIEMNDEVAATERLFTGLVEGIQMHSDILSVMDDIDNAYGNIMACHLSITVSTAVSLLLQLALSDDLQFVMASKIVFFVFAVFFLLGLFMCNAGEITYQASLIPDAFFYSGWHLCPIYHQNKNVRKLVTFAIAQAQQPVVMQAFKMFELTYATYIAVIKNTYSIYALFYAQNK